MSFGGLAEGKIRRSMELFAREVMPRFRYPTTSPAWERAGVLKCRNRTKRWITMSQQQAVDYY